MPCCSYCGNSDHNIRNCVDPSILIHYNHIQSIFIETANLNHIEFIYQICRVYNLSILRVVSVKFTYSNASLNKKEHAFKLYNHFHNMYSNHYLPYTPDTVPSYAQDLNQIDESNDISWFIDRNPMRNIIDEMVPLYNQTNIHTFINYEDYIAAEDEFIPISRNLQHDFEKVSNKKYFITPIVSRFNNNTNNNKKSKESCVLEDCPICYEPLKYEDTVTLNCNHDFCKTCIIQSLQSLKNGNPCCALCRTNICSMLVPDVNTYDVVAKFCIL